MLIQISGLAEGISTIIIEGSTEAMEFLDEMLSRGHVSNWYVHLQCQFQGYAQFVGNFYIINGAATFK